LGVGLGYRGHYRQERRKTDSGKTHETFHNTPPFPFVQGTFQVRTQHSEANFKASRTNGCFDGWPLWT